MEPAKPIQESQPKRRRYRIPRSCDRCRSSKLKCVFENGQCHACFKAGVNCTFANPGSLKERPPTFKDAEQLNARIRSLERLLQAVDPTIDKNHLPDPDLLVCRSNEAPNFPIQLPADCSSSPFHRRPASIGRQDSYEAHLSTVLSALHASRAPSKPSLTSTHWSQPDKSKPMTNCTGVATEPEFYIGPNAMLSVPDLTTNPTLNLPPRNAVVVYPVDDYLRLRHEEFVSSTRCFYPDPDLEQDLIKIYFQHFHPIVPILHPTAFYNLHNSGLAHTDPSFRALCLLMFCIASRWSTDPRVLLDLTGRPQSSRQFAGLRYSYAGYLGLFRLGNHRTTLFNLQAFVLLTLISLGSNQPTATWIFAEQGLTCAQECGAHREVHRRWNANPLEDYLRRQAFFHLYELGHRASSSLNRTPLMQEEDFDVEPSRLLPGDPLGIFVNPYHTIMNPAAHELYVAFDEVRALLWRLGSLRSLLPLLHTMQANAETSGGAASVKSLEALVDQLDLNARKRFDQVSPIFKRPDVEGCPERLMFSVLVITYYHSFQMMIHRNLFNHEGDDSYSRPMRTTSHINKCVEFGIASIQEINKLRLRNLLTSAFFWVPSHLMLAIIIVFCSIRKQRKSISPHENQIRRENILLAIAILDDLAPR
ncbi:hypothetical protein PGT21_019662 [Puccinia graminis f. sp. tritici]|uniref:Zn(2)-C6 fungal-type domain-containing protein n=1 Tax=Puccinia graminis f. sp. tritici TaxID=56615 RepID=A0A5B0NNJ5_PUCGR|nr:hypothetical protein PGT21_019662 [Puccinia graminis f. sp. tritici]